MSVNAQISRDQLTHYAMQIAAGLAANPATLSAMDPEALAKFATKIARQVVKQSRRDRPMEDEI